MFTQKSTKYYTSSKQKWIDLGSQYAHHIHFNDYKLLKSPTQIIINKIEIEIIVYFFEKADLTLHNY